MPSSPLRTNFRKEFGGVWRLSWLWVWMVLALRSYWGSPPKGDPNAHAQSQLYATFSAVSAHSYLVPAEFLPFQNTHYLPQSTTMPSHNNPNRPSGLKPRHVAAKKLKQKQANKQRVAKTTAPRTSQAIRKAAPLSKKKARKLDKKMVYARQRAVEAEFEKREVEMKDVGGREQGARQGGQDDVERMDIDVAS